MAARLLSIASPGALGFSGLAIFGILLPLRLGLGRVTPRWRRGRPQVQLPGERRELILLSLPLDAKRNDVLHAALEPRPQLAAATRLGLGLGATVTFVSHDKLAHGIPCGFGLDLLEPAVALLDLLGLFDEILLVLVYLAHEPLDLVFQYVNLGLLRQYLLAHLDNLCRVGVVFVGEHLRKVTLQRRDKLGVDPIRLVGQDGGVLLCLFRLVQVLHLVEALVKGLVAHREFLCALHC